MSQAEYNIYCDESCHLENDKQKSMVLGAVWLPLVKKREIFRRIAEIKIKHGFDHSFEVKWHKVSLSKIDFYIDLIDYFFDDDDFCFRGLVVPEKSQLNHQAFSQTHDEFYYKMYFDLIKIIIHPKSSYNIYLDIKDTLGYKKIEKLKEVLRNNHYDYSFNIIRKVQEVRSEEVAPLQLADLIIGAVSYIHRGLTSSPSKMRIVDRIKERAGYSLVRSTLPSEKKFNLFIWRPEIKPRENL